MLKVRVQGTKSDIRWFREKLEQHPHLAYPWKIVALMIPYILATSFFGLAWKMLSSN